MKNRNMVVGSVLYFAYGSNMSSRRLVARAPSAEKICTARLHGYRLSFHKKGRDGSGKCDVFRTGSREAFVHGVVFRLRASDKPLLDRYEGLGHGYQSQWVRVTNDAGESLTAQTYIATDVKAALNPYHWYKEHVLRGANEHNLPEEYIRSIQSVVSIADPCPENHEKELSIYGSP